MTFSGFPQEFIKFFADIRTNNNKEWFDEHKADYQNYVQTPSVDFVIELGSRLQTISPGIQFDTRLNGAGSVMRIYRDVRFSKDKTPYKTWQGISFWEGAKKKDAKSGFYFGFSDEGAGAHVGSHGFEKAYLAAFRDAVDTEKTGSALTSLLESLGTGTTINGDKLKTVPRGYDKDHPRGDLLKYKAMYASAPDLSVADLTSPELVAKCVAFFKHVYPLHKWLLSVG